ncbi:hypothetical protein BU24DRAFT_464816 [Aaosphaeria arxii CBS 175.79]|uniref:RING-type domain-containing protein n=1 Tax=Aaosphaeria arxii CBS 175.79 TaxID=1450172 RepID=A0A6A5XGV5_9PLEO|nr:uncharacterized protein BU24DRAFT_464816 [Aaosphaeria arxii CBS 175.79]KAF2012418.1 hypothetical protein BU24DRAFT_464816 [Aaosphaeria arxii CBS 175.79]
MALKFPSRDDFLDKCLKDIEMPTDNDWNCAICQEDNATSNKTRFIALDTCGHRFHRTCTRSWFAGGNDSCPLCRHLYYKEEMIVDVSEVLNDDKVVLLILADTDRFLNIKTALASSHDLDETRFRGTHRHIVENPNKESASDHREEKHMIIDMVNNVTGPIKMFLALAPTKLISLAEIQESSTPDMFEELTPELLDMLSKGGISSLDDIGRLSLNENGGSSKSSVHQDWTCPLCHQLQSPSPTVVNAQGLPICGHTIHEYCYDEWRKQGDVNEDLCPVCQIPVDSVGFIIDFTVPMSAPDVKVMILVDKSHLLNLENVMESSMPVDPNRFKKFLTTKVTFSLDCPPNCTDIHNTLFHIPTRWAKEGGAELFFILGDNQIVRLSQILAADDPNMFQSPEVMQQVLRDPTVLQATLVPEFVHEADRIAENATAGNTSSGRASRRSARRREARREARRRAREE